MAISIQDLLQNLTESGLLSDEEISTVHGFYARRGQSGTADEFAKELVRNNHLTKLQAAALLKGKTRNLIFGEYVILDKIGSGGMGQVFKARHQPTRKVVAVKVLSADAVSNRRLIERFKKEAEAIGRLKHPNVVRAYEAGKINKIRYLVMEFVDGENMLARVKRKGPLEVDEVVNCILQAARGLDYAHQKGIIHRDIKPSNLLRDRNTGRVKVVDLGLARVQEPDEDEEDQIRLTMAGQMLGTARFMAPEQVEDARKADVRSDIYSLACTMFFLLRGKAPFSGETVAHTLMAHVSAPIPDLCKKRSDAPAWLGQVFTKMMAKKPKNRYQSMAELVTDIQHHLSESLDDRVLDESQDADDEYSSLIARKDLGASITDLYVSPDEVAAAEAAEAEMIAQAEAAGPDSDSSSDSPAAETQSAETAVTNPDTPPVETPRGGTAGNVPRVPIPQTGPAPATDPLEAEAAAKRKDIPARFAPISRSDTHGDLADTETEAELDDPSVAGIDACEMASEADDAVAPPDADAPKEHPGSDRKGMSAAQSFNISDELNVAKEIDVTDYVTRKLKGRQNADAQTVRRYQIAGAVLGAIALVCLAVWIFQSQ
jgi:serine/threonine protein kinase